MMSWKGGLAGVVFGTAAICAGCGAGADRPDENAAVASAPEASIGLATARFSVDGMTCGGCVLATEMAVKRVDGVRSVTARMGDDGTVGSATVEYEVGRADPEAIAAAIRRAGFTPRLEEGPPGGA
jgi:copper chaperone CopZ